MADNTNQQNNQKPNQQQPSSSDNARERVKAAKANQENPLKDIAEKLRQQNDSTTQKNDMQKALKEAVKISSDAFKQGNSSLRKESISALKDIRSTIQQMTFKDDQEKAKYLELYDKTLEQFEKTNSNLGKLVKEQFGQKAGGFWSTIKKSAWESQNPVVKAGWELIKGTKEGVEGFFGKARAVREAERKAELEKVAKELDGLESVKEGLDKTNQSLERVKGGNEKASRTSQKPREGTQRGPLVTAMEAVEKNAESAVSILELLFDVLTANEGLKVHMDGQAADSATPQREVEKSAPTQQPSPVLERTVSDILAGIELGLEEMDKMNKSLDVLVKQAEMSLKVQRDQQMSLERQELQKIEADNESHIQQGHSSTVGVEAEKAKSGIMESLLEFVPAFIEGLIGGSFLKKLIGDESFIGKMLGKGKKAIEGVGNMFKEEGVLGRIFGFFGKFGEVFKLGRAIPVVGEIIAVVTSVFDFFSGFFNADKILGKATTGFFDKVSAGIGSLLGGITSIFDMVAGWFGFNTDFGKKVTASVSKFIDAIPQAVETAASTLWNYLTGIDWSQAWKAPVDGLIKGGQFIIDSLLGSFRGMSGLLAKGLDKFGLGDTSIAKALESFAQGSDAGGSTDVAQPAVQPNSNKVTAAELKQGDAEVQDAKQKAEDKKSDKSKGGTAVVDNSSVVNAPTTNIYPTRLSTRNDERSIKKLAFG